MNFLRNCFEEFKVQVESGLRDEMLWGVEVGASELDFHASTSYK